jgi:hypothetical protein
LGYIAKPYEPDTVLKSIEIAGSLSVAQSRGDTNRPGALF